MMDKLLKELVWFAQKLGLEVCWSLIYMKNKMAHNQFWQN